MTQLLMRVCVFFQVAQLRAENSTIMKRVAEITLKFQEAAMENRVLKADVASLQAKVSDTVPCPSSFVQFCKWLITNVYILPVSKSCIKHSFEKLITIFVILMITNRICVSLIWKVIII